jgi:GNAT superfamily N-acetyltransferase
VGVTGVEIRRLVPGDAPTAAALYGDALGHTFFAALGQRFLRAYWRALAMAPTSVGFVATFHGEPVGFVIGTLDPSAQRRWIVRRHAWPLLFHGVVGMLRQPAEAVRFGRTRALRYGRGLWRYLRAPASTREGSAPDGPRIGVLLHIMVAPHAQALGVGRRLATAFMAMAAKSDVSELQLITLAGPAGAAGFWRAMGWESAGEAEDADRRRIERFRYPLVASRRDRAIAAR